MTSAVDAHATLLNAKRVLRNETHHQTYSWSLSCCAAGWKRALPQLQLSWDTWVLTAAAASLSWVMWRRHKRLLQMQHTSHTRGNSETGVG